MELCVVSMELWARHMDRHCVVDKIVTFWGAEFPFFSESNTEVLDQIYAQDYLMISKLYDLHCLYSLKLADLMMMIPG